jgi:hypothetical protein
MRTRRVVLVLAVLAGVFLCAAATRPTAAAFTASSGATTTYTVDKLANYFAVAAGTSTQPSGGAPISAGDVDTQTLTFGTVPSAQAFPSVFTVRNTTGAPQQAVLTLTGDPELASAVFTSTGTGTDTIPAGATRTVQMMTANTVAGRGTATVRLRQGGYTWLYRDYAATIDLAPEAPGSLVATARAAGRISLAWGGSSTVTGLAGYNVYRKTGAGAYTKLNATPLVATTYDDDATVDGTTYTYTVRALTTNGVTLESVDSATATATADATPPAQPGSVSLANGGGAGNAYVNSGNAGSISVAVGLPASSIASDTLTVTVSNGASSVTTTAAASAGAGTVTLTGITASSLADGTLTIGVTSTDLAGNVSTVRSTTVTKDTAVAAPSASYVDQKNQNDQITGSTEAGATVTANQTAPSAAGPYTTTATAGGAYTLTVARNKNVTVTYSVVATDVAGNTSAATVLTFATNQ